VAPGGEPWLVGDKEARLRPEFKDRADDLSRIRPASERETLRNDEQR
jgi:hypothetical protein